MTTETSTHTMITVFNQLRTQLESVDLQPGADQSLERIHLSLLGDIRRTLVHSHREVEGRNPVLSLILSSRLGYDLRDEDFSKAFRAYIEYRDVYLKLVGNWIPDSFKTQVDEYVSEKQYVDGEGQSVADDAAEYTRQLNRGGIGPSCFATGISCLDEALGGGLQGLTFLGGDKGVGKTWLQLKACEAALTSGDDTAVVFFSLDMPKSRIMDRLVCRSLGIDFRQLKSGKLDDVALLRVKEALQQPHYQRLRIVQPNLQLECGESCQEGATSIALTDMLGQVDRLWPFKRILVIIDLFQKLLMSGSQTGTLADPSRLDLIDHLRKKIGRHVGDGNVAILVSSEVRKGGIDNGGRLHRDDLKGDGRIASDADCILLLHEPRGLDVDQNEVVLTIDKGRDGVRRGDFPLVFNHRTGQFGVPAESSNRQLRSDSMPGVATGAVELDPFGGN
ncbi:DnaB-like helicase C-terminal domain-containing protein [Rosistilla oblonga]|uniref:DnaB-like helicase C-terminal domain-containing protein n=1 Tax=Rosistilla oblonga TaxID=2527990 RepID=UPI003A97C843